MDDNQDFPTVQQCFKLVFLQIISTHCEVFEEEIAPVVFDIEKEAEDEHHVHEADEDDHHHPCVD